MKNINILKDLKTLNKLHAPSVESHTTNNGIVDFACDNAGYVDNVVVEGETLVNLVNLSTVNELEELFYVYNEPYLMFSNKTYTIVNNFNKDVYFEIKDFAGVFLRSYLVPPNSSDKISLSENECILSIAFKKVDGWTFELVEDNKNRGVVILEGDHTDKPISYFEGLKSVGQGDKIEVLTTPIHNNLIPQNYTKGEGYWTSMVDVGSVFSDSNWYRILEYIPVKPNTQYTGLYTGTQVVYYDENKNTIYHNQSDLVLGYEYHIFTTPQNAKYIRVSYPKDKEGNICIFEGVKHDKKQISTTLRSLPNGVKDTIEKRGNKYVKVQRCGEIVLNGDMLLSVSEITNNCMYGVFKVDNFKIGDRYCLISDFVKTQYDISIECIFCEVDGKSIYLNISVNRLSSPTLQGFKTWLSQNPVTVVYELETPIITELPNFNPQTYKGDNTLIVNSGVIQCDASFDVCEGIRSELDVIKDKVSSLDCDYVEDIELQFLNGWSKNTSGYYSAKMVNGVAYINLLCSGGIGTAGTSICYIKDQKFIPKTNMPIIIGTNDGLYVNAFIQVTGKIVIDNVDIPPNLWISICVSYPIL